MTLFTDFVQGPGASAAAVANRTSLGTLTLPQSARMITRFWVTAAPVGTYAANKPLVGYIVAESEDIQGLQPYKFPLEPVASYITLGNAGVAPPTKWVVNARCDGGSKITFYMVADAAPNAAPEVQVTTEFSDGGSPFAGGQLHQQIGEPAVSLSTSDNGTASLTDIEIKASHLIMLWTYGVYTTPVADTAVVATLDVTSDDFAIAGPHKFGLNPQVGGDANLVGARAELTKIPMDIAFRVLKQKQTLSCIATMRDAVSTAPVANWGAIYRE